MGKDNTDSEIKKSKKRKNQRRGIQERRDSVRWEPDKSGRRSKKDRRISEPNWDDVIKRR